MENGKELNIKRLLKDIFECIVKNISSNNQIESNNSSNGNIHSERSKAWIKKIATSLQNYYGDEYVFWRDYPNIYFSYNEILFDIVVSKIGFEKSPTGKEIPYLRDPI
jgi:hypothetical protein